MPRGIIVSAQPTVVAMLEAVLGGRHSSRPDKRMNFYLLCTLNSYS